MSQTFLFFEQQTLDAEQAALQAKRAAKEAAAKARAEAKQKEEREKSTRRLMREAEYRRKHPPALAISLRAFPFTGKELEAAT